MKEGYIPKDKRKKILLLSDDIRTMSGVGNQAKEIILNTTQSNDTKPTIEQIKKAKDWCLKYKLPINDKCIYNA